MLPLVQAQHTLHHYVYAYVTVCICTPRPNSLATVSVAVVVLWYLVLLVPDSHVAWDLSTWSLSHLGRSLAQPSQGQGKDRRSTFLAVAHGTILLIGHGGI